MERRREAGQPLLPGLSAIASSRRRRPSWTPPPPARRRSARLMDRQCRSRSAPTRPRAAVPSPSLQKPQRPRLLFMLPAAALLLVFLHLSARPRRLARLHRHAHRPRRHLHRPRELPVSLGRQRLLARRCSTRLLYTAVASILKFALGLWLALLLNEHLPFKAFFRAIVLLPWVVPTVLSAIAFWWIYDASSRSSPGCCIEARADRRATSTSSAIRTMRAPPSSSPMSGAASPSSRSRCSPACRPSRRRSTRRRRSTARPAGSGSATSPCRC